MARTCERRCFSTLDKLRAIMIRRSNALKNNHALQKAYKNFQRIGGSCVSGSGARISRIVGLGRRGAAGGCAVSLKDQMFKCTGLQPVNEGKISIIGCGQVGITACGFLLQRNLAKELCLMDLRDDWIKAEALDLLHASVFLNNPKVITCSKDVQNTKDSKYVIITAGARPIKGDRMGALQKSAEIMKTIVPNLVKASPKAIFIVVSNPADIMTWLVQKFGNLPPTQCFSTGCHLDTARFRYFIAQRLGVAPSSVNGYIIGEHGTSCVPVWSSVVVGGVPLRALKPDIGTETDDEKWSQVQQQVVTGASSVSSVKGYTNWAVALTVVDVIDALQENSGRILSVATDAKGMNCIDENIVLSLPCALRANGICNRVQLPLTDWEQKMLLKSADTLLEAQCKLNI